MTDNQSQHSLGDTLEGPPVKRPCTSDTPPIALTPGDDGSDFYNTPWTAGTPVASGEKEEDGSFAETSEPTATSNLPPVIPGLNLVNDGFKRQQPGQSDSTVPETVNIESTKAEAESKPAAAHNDMDTGVKGAEGLVLGSIDAMDVEEDQKQHQEEAGSNKNLEDKANGSGDANNSVTASGVEVTESAQDEQEDEHPEWEIDSSPYESSSDDSSTDSSDESDEDDEDYPILSPEEQARILMQGETGSDDEGEGKGKSGVHLRTANEIPEEVLPIPDITITPGMKIVYLGNVQAVVENTVLIAANTSGEYQVLESGSLLCFEDRKIAGVVSETLGRVENPLYTVRFATAAAVEEQGISIGKAIYYVEDHSTFVFTQPLKGMKGSDASNFHDEEVAEDEVEFSDDEAEAEYRKKLKQKRQEKKEAKSGNRKGLPGPSKLSQSELNYDDNPAEDGYTPLARPKNLHEMMRQEAPLENDNFSGRNSGFRGGRGRGRGSDRGRGGRGRGGRDYYEPHSHHDQQSHSHHSRVDSRPHAHQPPPMSSSTFPQNPQPATRIPQPFPAYAHILQPSQQQQQQQQPQQLQQQQHGVAPMAPFNFQMPFQQAFQQPNPYQQMQPNTQLNPLFLAALQQQQQQQQQQQHQQVPGQQQVQNPAMNFDQVKAQLDLLRQLSNNGNQWPPRS